MTGKGFFYQEIVEGFGCVKNGELDCIPYEEINARETFRYRNVWTVDGRIFYIENGSQHAKIYYN